jgi:hypothetical protein
MNNHVEALQIARELLVKGWTKGAYARAADNTPVSFANKDAFGWCMVGACYKANGLLNIRFLECNGLQYLWKAVKLGNEPELTHWNDAPGRTLDDVLAVYDKAIELAIGEE